MVLPLSLPATTLLLEWISLNAVTSLMTPSSRAHIAPRQSGRKSTQRRFVVGDKPPSVVARLVDIGVREPLPQASAQG